MIRVVLPTHLRQLAKIRGEVLLNIEAPVTQRKVLDVLEGEFPVLRGTIRDQVTLQRRSFIRFFACGEDLSHQPADDLLPEKVVSGEERYIVVGAMAGG